MDHSETMRDQTQQDKGKGVAQDRTLLAMNTREDLLI